jgi:hypothetical protein
MVHRQSWVWALIFVLLIAGLVVAAKQGRPTARQVRQKLLAELRPVTLSNCRLERFGSFNDGGYLMCGNLLGRARSAYSYGIGPADDWGCEVSETLRIPVHQYDCFDPGRPVCPNGRAVFHDECIGPGAEMIDGRVFDSFTRQVTRNGDAGKTLIMKIDVEGAEVPALMATPDEMLNRIDQLAMEIHGTDRSFLRLVQKLKRTFYLAHLHFNNQACGVRYSPLPAWAYQVLFVNKRIGIVNRSAPSPYLPHPLDAPDFALGGDCQINGRIEP